MKKKKLYYDMEEFKEMHSKESERIESLLKNPVFLKEREEALKSDKKRPNERQDEMKAKQDAFCKKYDLLYFPHKLNNEYFIPVIGANLEIDIKGRLVWVLEGPLTSIEQKHRLLPQVQQFQDALYGKPSNYRRRQEVRDKELYDLYYDNNGKKRPCCTYKNVTGEYLDRHPEFLTEYSGMTKEDIVEELMSRVIKAIKREKMRRIKGNDN